MKPVKLGVIGVSGHFIKRTLLPLLKSEKTLLYAIASRNEDKAKATAEKYRIPKWYGSYEALLQDKDVEMVYLPLPNHIHAEWIKKCADAGKAILCEKPLALNAGEAEEAVNYARKKQVMIMEAFMYRFQPQWIRAKELCDTGEIGSVRGIHTFFSYNNPDPDNIRNIAEFGGGALLDIGCYAISAPRFILGKEPVRAVSAIGNDPQFNIDNLTSGMLDFGEVRALFTVSTNTFPHQQVAIYGSSGDIVVHVPFNTYVDVPASITVRNAVGSRDILFDPADQYGLQFDAFSEALRNNRPAPVAPEDAVNNMKAIDAIFRSAKSGNWETV